MITIPPPVVLHFKEGSSDKLYSVAIDSADGFTSANPDRATTGGRFIVVFTYGRAGSAQKAGTKTQTPVSLAKAIEIYEKLIQEKTSKGYRPVGEAPEYSLTGEEGKDTGFRCQLLNPMSREEVDALIDSWDWCMQRKYDGERRGVRNTDHGVIITNRKGQVVAGSEALKRDVAELPAGTQFDGEDMGDLVRVFDILESDGVDLRHRTYGERLQELRRFWDGWPTLKGVTTALTPDQKKDMMRNAIMEKWEGVVFKRLDSPYSPGRPASGGNQLKFKFIESCSCIVNFLNPKRSVQVCMFNDEGRMIVVGNVSIPLNHDIPPVNVVIEVHYLYAYPGGSLFQPVYKGVRTDLQMEDCLLSRLKFKTD